MSRNGLHPLEIIALQDLPWDARVKRIASLAIRKRFGYLPYKILGKHITPIVNKLSEPRGRKGKLRKELLSEILRQRKVRRSRRTHTFVQAWANRCFKVKSPRRKTWREIPFKESKRRSR